MQHIDDPRLPLRFTQNEGKTDAALRDGSLPQWHRNFLNMMWYARIPASVWNDIYLRASKYTSLKLLNGEPVALESGQIAVIEHLTNIASALYTCGALPCKDTKAIAGIFKLGVDNANYPAQLEQMARRIKELEAQVPREVPAVPQLTPDPVVPDTPELPPAPAYEPEPEPEPEPASVVEAAPVYQPEPEPELEPAPVLAPVVETAPEYRPEPPVEGIYQEVDYVPPVYVPPAEPENAYVDVLAAPVDAYDATPMAPAYEPPYVPPAGTTFDPDDPSTYPQV